MAKLSTKANASVDAALYSSLIEEYEQLTARQKLLPWLRAVSSNANTLQRVASRSYRHKNGFDKIVLAYHGRSYPCIRLHYWPQSGVLAEPDIHTHPWAFRSTVMAGHVVDFRYSETMPAKEARPIAVYKNVIAADEARPAGAHVRCLGTSILYQTSKLTVQAGSQYSFDVAVCHATVPSPTEETVTAFLQLEFQCEESLVYARTPDVVTERNAIVTFSPPCLAEKLKRLEKLLEKG